MIEAKLLIAPGCQYCSSMMTLLGEMLKDGSIARLLMINIAEQPDEAARHNVRSVPWLKLGDMEFSGAQSRAELEKAIEMANSDNGHQQYLFEQLKNGRLDEAAVAVGEDQLKLKELLSLLNEDEVPMSVRIGVSAILEGLQTNPAVLNSILPELLELSTSPDETTRADACHFLSLEGSDEAKKRLQQCTGDDSEMVREIAEESLEQMK